MVSAQVYVLVDTQPLIDAALSMLATHVDVSHENALCGGLVAFADTLKHAMHDVSP